MQNSAERLCQAVAATANHKLDVDLKKPINLSKQLFFSQKMLFQAILEKRAIRLSGVGRVVLPITGTAIKILLFREA